MISIAIASKNKDDLKTISALLAKQDDFRIINTGEDAYDALMSVKHHQPDILIMDFTMGDYDSLTLAPLIKSNSPSTALIVLCSHSGHNTVAQALKAGISGYLLRQEGFDDLAFSVRSVFNGGLYISNSVKSHALHCFSIPADAVPANLAVPRNAFTPTELGIFYGITRGYTDREIAKDLNMSIGSVRNCINQVKKKTGLRNRTQITVHALFAGIMSIRKILGKDMFGV